MSLTHRRAPAHGHEAFGIERHTQIEHGSSTFYATRDPTKETKRAWQLGLIILEQEMDEFFWRAVAVEGLGMLGFVFAICTMICTYQGDVTQLESDRLVLIAITFGIAIAVLVFISAGISGGNLNPAVSICLALGKRISLVRCFLYIIAQSIGAIIGAGFAKVCVGVTKFDAGSGGANTLGTGYVVGQAICGEIICTCILCLTVLIGLSGELWDLLPKAKMHVLLPLMVGAAVTLCHLVMVPIDGTSVNPARSFGPAVVSGVWDNHEVFWIGPIFGAIIAILLWEGILRPPQIVHVGGKSPSHSSSKRASHTNGDSSSNGVDGNAENA